MDVNFTNNKKSFEVSKDFLVEFLRRVQKKAQDSFLKEKINSFLNSGPDYSNFVNFFPISDRSTFYSYSKSHLFNGLGVRIIPSAGSTGKSPLCFRAKYEGSLVDSSQQTGELARLLGFDPKKNIFLSAYPAAIEYPACFKVLECGARPDHIESFIRDYSDCYENFVIICQSHCLNYLIKWGQYSKNLGGRLKIVLGGSLVLANQNKFYQTELKVDQNQMSNLYGLAEISMGFAMSTPNSNGFLYDPKKLFLEIINNELIVTYFGEDQQSSLIRYGSGDFAEWTGDHSFLLSGRGKDGGINFSEKNIDQLYALPSIARNLTGRARVASSEALVEVWSDTDLSFLFSEVTKNEIDLGKNKVSFVKAGPDLISLSPNDFIDFTRKPVVYGKT